MAHPGYLAIGVDNPHEVVNNNRALAYAAGMLPWLRDCDYCPDLDDVIVPGVLIEGGGPYLGVIEDPAPWYNRRNIDSAGFLGVLGLEMTGAENSTRSARVTPALRGGGVIGHAYEAPRVIVLRAMAIAESKCSLQYGLRWLNEQFLTVDQPCDGDPAIFFECCPDADCDEDERPVGPCWPTTYAQLKDPPCDPDWWPATYGDVKLAPPYLRTVPAGEGDWCDWVGIYHELRTWLPPWSCCHELFVIPRMKQFADARVTTGPTVLRNLNMSVGAMAEIEFTITTGNPTALPAPFSHPDTWAS